MLLEIAIGDAYGAGFEFSSADKIAQENDLTHYSEHDKNKTIGCYTDDTQMSLALAECIIEKQELNTINIANKFVECFKRDPRLGYAQGLYDLFASVQSGTEFLNQIKPLSKRNGAAMRSIPLGVIKDINQLLQSAEIQASITHNTREGILSSQAIALCAHFFIYNKGNKQDLVEFVSVHTNTSWKTNWQGEVPCLGLETA